MIKSVKQHLWRDITFHWPLLIIFILASISWLPFSPIILFSLNVLYLFFIGIVLLRFKDIVKNLKNPKIHKLTTPHKVYILVSSLTELILASYFGIYLYLTLNLIVLLMTVKFRF